MKADEFPIAAAIKVEPSDLADIDTRLNVSYAKPIFADRTGKKNRLLLFICPPHAYLLMVHRAVSGFVTFVAQNGVSYQGFISLPPAPRPAWRTCGPTIRGYVIFKNLEQARQRLQDSKPLTADELRGFFPLLHELAFYTGFPERIQIEMALQQIAAIDRFNQASGRLTKFSIVASCLQVLVAAVALWIALGRK